MAWLHRYKHWLIWAMVLLLSVGMAGCGDERISVLQPAGGVGEQQLRLMFLSFFVMLGVFAVVMALYIYVLIRFRSRDDGYISPSKLPHHGSTKMELVWTIIPVLILVVLAVPSVRYTFESARKPVSGKLPLRVDVKGYRYWWSIEYPDFGIKTAGEIHIPKDTPVVVQLESGDVIHGFWIPSLAGKMDTVPGKKNYMSFNAKEAGVFEGRCAELCGGGHSLMNFRVYVHEEEDFQRWVRFQKAIASGASSDVQNGSLSPVAKRGKELFNQGCVTCHAYNKAPDLKAFCSRSQIAGTVDNNEDNFAMFLKKPSDVKPNILMPPMGHLSEDERRAIWQYLQSFCKTG